jgi:16S rRNA processing protein RimM
MPGDMILMGVVGRPHGVRGLVRVHSYTAEPADLDQYAPLLDAKGRAWSIAWRSEGVAELRDAAGQPVCDRGAAEKLVNLQLFVERGRLPAPKDDDEFYVADLVGLFAHNGDGALIGRIEAVHDYGAGTFLEILREGRASLLLPFSRAAVPHVDLAARRVTVAIPDELDVREDAA